MDLPTDVESLRRAVEAGERFDYLMFWGHTPGRERSVDASCLSQWFCAPFTVDGQVYPTAEHWMMAGKARLFADTAAIAEVLGDPEPRTAKAIGRRVRGFDEAAWRSHRVDLIVAGNRHKFGQDEPLRRFLLDTGDRVLVEASPYDRIWGIGMGRDDPAATDPARWRGANLLGFALMLVRAQLRP